MNWMKWKGTTPQRQTPTISSWRNSNERPLTATYLPINRDRYGSNISRPGTINMNRKPYRISRNQKEVSKEAEKGEEIGNEFIGGVIPLNKKIDMSLYKSPKVYNNGQKEEDFWLVSPKTVERDKTSLGLSQLAKFKNSIERTKAGTDERYYTNTIEYDEEITKTKEEEKNDSYNDSCDKLPFEIYSDLVTKGFNKTKDSVSNLFSKFGNNKDKIKTDPIEEIKKYKELLDSGIINQEEFDKKKKELLNL